MTRLGIVGMQQNVLYASRKTFKYSPRFQFAHKVTGLNKYSTLNKRQQ